jgi:RNA polymerase sigma-70 factor (ECF subfamily)
LGQLCYNYSDPTIQSRNANHIALRINNESNLLPSRDVAVQEELSDEVLVARMAGGDSTALEALYDRHASTVLGILVKVIGDRAAAEDVLQETFWRVWKSASSFDSQRGSLTGWLFRIARNLAIDAHRRMNVRPQALGSLDSAEALADQTADPTTDVPEQVQAAFRSRQVRSALAALPGLQRQVIELAYFYGMTRQEIAEATGEALGTIHTRARLGLQRLREELERVELEG